MMRAVLLALLLATLVAPAALADHTFSHRVYVVGRVVDADGLPAPGLPVNATFSSLPHLGRCFDGKDETTGPRGDFVVCRHAHAIGADARVNVSVGGASRNVSVDEDLRHASVAIQLPEPRSLRDVTGDRTFARTFHVSGRSFALVTGGVDEDGRPVDSTPVFENVSVALLAGDETLASANATVDSYGSYAADLDVVEVPADAIVRVTSGGDVVDEKASALFRRADVNVVRDLRLAAGPGANAPGSTTPAPAWLALVALAAALALVGKRMR